MSNGHRFVATTTRGAEPGLAGELVDLGLASVAEVRGAVIFTGPLRAGLTACLWSRLASRVLLELGRFRAPHADALYDGVHRIPWADHLGHRSTLAVDFVGTSPSIRNSRFGALVVKDAVVDRVRDRAGQRPSVDLERPDLRIHARLSDGVATVSLDLAGEPLHRRGVGRSGGAAPLKENLAAAILRRAGYRGRRPLVDPMCGSGTLALEAAEIALDRAPGLARRRWGFDRWRGMERATWDALYEDARARAAGSSASVAAPVILGRAHNPGALARARANAERRGLSARVRLEVGDLADAAAPDGPPGVVVTNPPYGERVGGEQDLPALYRALGDVMKRGFPGWTGWVFAGERALAGRIGLRPSSRTPLWNGRIECRLLEFALRAPRPGSDGPGWRRD